MRSEKQNDTRYLHSPLRTPKVTNATSSASTYIKICSHMMRTVHLCASVAPVRGHNQIGFIFSAESLLPLHLLNDNTGLMCLTFTDDLYRRSVRLVSRRKNVKVCAVTEGEDTEMSVCNHALYYELLRRLHHKTPSISHASCPPKLHQMLSGLYEQDHRADLLGHSSLKR